jgi:membrane protein
VLHHSDPPSTLAQSTPARASRESAPHQQLSDPPGDGQVVTPVDAAWAARLLDLIRWLDRGILSRQGWPRILRNTVIGFVVQAGTRMAAALSYYALFAAGPTLVLTIALGSLLFGEDDTRQIVAMALRRLLPPSAGAATAMAEQAVRTSAPATTMALVTACIAMIGFTRALTTSLNVMFNLAGSEPVRRTVRLVPLLYLTMVGLLWGSWLLALLARFAEATAPGDVRPFADMIVRTVAPLLLAWVHFSIMLRIVPRARLALVEILVPAAIGATLWEGARHLFGWLIGTDSFYLRLFGSLGGVVALLGWIYLSSSILVLTGQLAWAYAMERRGRGDLARKLPREAGLDASVDPFAQDNAVNEAHGC